MKDCDHQYVGESTGKEPVRCWKCGDNMPNVGELMAMNGAFEPETETEKSFQELVSVLLNEIASLKMCGNCQHWWGVGIKCPAHEDRITGRFEACDKWKRPI